MDDLKNGTIIGYDYYIKLFAVISLLMVGGLLSLIVAVPALKIFTLGMLPIFIAFPITVIGIVVTLITERKKIMFRIEKDYSQTCECVEKYLKSIHCDYSKRKNTVPIFNTGTLIITQSNFKINIKKAPFYLVINMGPIKTIKFDNQFLEKKIIEEIRKIK